MLQTPKSLPLKTLPLPADPMHIYRPCPFGQGFFVSIKYICQDSSLSGVIMSIYETIKNQVTTRQAAERYGLKVGRNGMCKCPFHNDKNPSMKVDKRFHCFGCQADGDVISFTSRLFHIPPREAALKLADEFGIQHDQQKSEPYVRKHYQIKAEDILAHKISYCIRELTIYRNQLLMWKKQYLKHLNTENL